MKPTNSPTQGQPSPRKKWLKGAFGPLFPTASKFSWVDWFYTGDRLQETQPKQFFRKHPIIFVFFFCWLARYPRDGAGSSATNEPRAVLGVVPRLFFVMYIFVFSLSCAVLSCWLMFLLLVLMSLLLWVWVLLMRLLLRAMIQAPVRHCPSIRLYGARERDHTVPYAMFNCSGTV